MNNDSIVVIVIIAVAALWTLWSLWRWLRGSKTDCGCGDCPSRKDDTSP